MSQTEKYSSVWVYWSEGADGDELRYSIASAMQNLSDVENVVVCGDKPDWYTGDFIDSPRVSEKVTQQRYGLVKYQKWADSIEKLMRIIADPRVTENFLWMYDDTFVWEEFSIAEIAVPRASSEPLYLGPLDIPAMKGWRDVLRLTAKDLSRNGFNTANYSSHYPVVFNKHLLRETIDRFDLTRHARAIESLYLNHHNRFFGSLEGVFEYQGKVTEEWEPRKGVKVVNVGAWSRRLEELVTRRFSDYSVGTAFTTIPSS